MEDQYIREGVQLTADEAAEYDKLQAEHDYADRLQYIFKIRLNSLYGAVSNQMFRLYELMVAESTTATGRMVARHQRSQINYETHQQYVDVGLAVLAGDTDSCYFKLDVSDDASIDEMVVRADEIGRKVNASFPDFMKRAFLCSEDNSKLMGCAREVIFDRVIFVEKKRYIGHVVDDEGHRVDKFKVVGLDIKKTTLPREISSQVEFLVHRILKGDSWDAIAADTIKLKDKLRAQPIHTLGLPKGLNKGLEQHTINIRNDPNYNVPGHVRAGIYYNQKLKEYNDTLSMKVVSGMKIRVFYLKNPDGKFKSICLPTDLDEVPEWFKDIEIDVEAQIVRLVDRPFENILKAIGKQAPTRQTILIDQLVEF